LHNCTWNTIAEKTHHRISVVVHLLVGEGDFVGVSVSHTQWCQDKEMLVIVFFRNDSWVLLAGNLAKKLITTAQAG